MVNYKSGKGIVEVKITRHAVFQMQDRYYKLFDRKITATQAEQQIVKRFPGCNRVKNLKQIEKSRIKKYGGVTLFFRDLDFTFIVQDARLMSVEISRLGKRHLNKTEDKDLFTFAEVE